MAKRLIISGYFIGSFDSNDTSSFLLTLESLLQSNFSKDISLNESFEQFDRIRPSDFNYEDGLSIMPTRIRPYEEGQLLKIEGFGFVNIIVINLGKFFDIESMKNQFAINLGYSAYITTNYSTDDFKYGFLPELYKKGNCNYIIECRNHFGRTINKLLTKEESVSSLFLDDFLYNYMIRKKAFFAHVDFNEVEVYKLLDLGDSYLLEVNENNSGLLEIFDYKAKELGLINSYDDYE